jgi:hypothetical protein
MSEPIIDLDPNFSTKVVATLQDIRFQANSIENSLSVVENSLSTYAPINSPSFTGEVSFSSASVIGIDLLPNQSGNSGKFLSTNGTNALWETLSLNFDDDQNILASRIFG